MSPRFGGIKFNLLKALEILQDLNHEDMDVTAPPSNNFYKELEVAQKLNDCLTELITNGLFDDCDPRSEEDEIYGDSEDDISTPESEGFDYSRSRSDDGSSRGSFASRFKRYVRRMLPGGGSRSRGQPENEENQSEVTTDYSEEDEDGVSGGSRSERSGSASRQSQVSRASSRSKGSRRLATRNSRSRERRGFNGSSRQSSGSQRATRERSASEPFDSNVVYEHTHRHKHNHPGPHHHHHRHENEAHKHTYHRHADEKSPTDNNEGVSDVYRANSNDDLDSTNSGSYRARSHSNGRLQRSASSGKRRSTSRRLQN